MSPVSPRFHAPSLRIALFPASSAICHGAALALVFTPRPVLSSGLIYHCSDISELALDTANDIRALGGVDCGSSGSFCRTETTLLLGDRYSDGARIEPASDSAIVSRSKGRVLTRPGWNAGAMSGASRVFGEVGGVLEAAVVLVPLPRFIPRGWTTEDGGIGETGEEASELVREEVPSVCEKRKDCCVELSTEEFEESRSCDLSASECTSGSVSVSRMTSSGFVGSGH